MAPGRGGEHDPLACLDLEPAAVDRRGGVAGRVAAAGDPRPEAAVVDRLEKEALGLAVGDHVLVEAQLAARADDPAKLRERLVLVGDRAEDEAGDGRVDALVLER